MSRKFVLIVDTFSEFTVFILSIFPIRPPDIHHTGKIIGIIHALKLTFHHWNAIM